MSIIHEELRCNSVKIKGAIQISMRPGILTTYASLIASKSRTPLLFETVSRATTYGSAGRSGPLRLFRRAALHFFLQLRRGPPFMGPADRGPPLLHHWSSLILLVCSVHAKRLTFSKIGVFMLLTLIRKCIICFYCCLL